MADKSDSTTPGEKTDAEAVPAEPDPVVQQILSRREEIRVHQQILKELESSLSDSQRAELAKAGK